jgi:hypothetical protein
MGPTELPRFILVADNPIAMARVSTLHTSASIPDPTARTPDPSMPCINLDIIIVCTLCARLCGIWKIATPTIAINSGVEFPTSCDRGAKNNGPTAYPATKSATLRFITCTLTPYSSAVVEAAGPKILLANAVRKTIAQEMRVNFSFLDSGQFKGSVGSLGVYVTRNGSGLSSVGDRFGCGVVVIVACCFSRSVGVVVFVVVALAKGEEPR